MPSELRIPSEKDLEKNRFLGIIEGSSARIIFNLTSGAFLVGLLKYMGASDSVCGYIIAMPVLAAVIQVLSPIVLESRSYRKTIIIIGTLIHRVLLSTLFFIPFLPVGTNARLWITAAVFFISNLAVSFVTPAISNMYISFVPQNIRGKYFGGRESCLLLAATIVTLILGRVLDAYNDAGNEGGGYIAVYAVVFFFTLVNFCSYILMKEVPQVHNQGRMKLTEIFTLPFKNRRFITYFIMLVIWNLAVQIASAYFSVYLKSDLKLSYTIITVLSMINAVFYVMSARLWGRFADRKGWAATTWINIMILGLCHLFWFFSSKGSPIVLLTLIFAHVTGGIAWSGINVSLFNLQFDFTPEEKRTVYIGFSAAISGFIGYLAAVLGAQLVGAFGHNSIIFLGMHCEIKQVLFAVSSLLLIICTLFVFLFMRQKNYKEELQMFKKQSEMSTEIREKMRGGNGQVKLLNIFNKDELKGKCRLFSRITLEPGCSIGTHAHDQEEEIFYILSGKGVVDDNGQLREIGPGDAVLTRDGKFHSIANTGDEPLVFMAVILLY